MSFLEIPQSDRMWKRPGVKGPREHRGFFAWPARRLDMLWYPGHGRFPCRWLRALWAPSLIDRMLYRQRFSFFHHLFDRLRIFLKKGFQKPYLKEHLIISIKDFLTQMNL